MAVQNQGDDMALSWNEIKDRALRFSKEWQTACNEEADAKPFLHDFFEVFGLSRKKVATFEHKVKKLNEHDGYIDLFWKGMLLVEMKSQGKNLDKAYEQAREYVNGTVKQEELPSYILISDFQTFRLYDCVEESVVTFSLVNLVENVHSFGFMLGYQKREFKEQDPVNIKAAELMGKLHDRLKAIGYTGHVLELYLVRLLFCLFADDTTIFEKDIFSEFLKNRTSADGSDLAARLSEIFYILNTPVEKRLKNLDEDLNAFPYVNGGLFQEFLPPASFDSSMRATLLECCLLDWGKISPAIFGSMFQTVMKPEERRNLGAHYTSEKNIMKLIKPLFLDELRAEFQKVKGNSSKLKEFHNKLASLKFLDPACGCGNFLIITYRELRLLELEILRELNRAGQLSLDISHQLRLDVNMMYGIEYEEFPARIAEVAMWLIDHQMNMMISHEFGQYVARLPLKKSAKIIHGNALRINWEEVVAKEELSYILGNPPFIGSRIMNSEQKDDIMTIFSRTKGVGDLDYVTAWYKKSSDYIQNTEIKVAFVSTNSIVQGIQPAILWKELFLQGVQINFAHRTFKWNNEARGNAAVYCVIVGFSLVNGIKTLFEYDSINGEPHEVKVKNINGYLIDFKNVFTLSRTSSLCEVPQMVFGNMPNDDGEFLFTREEMEAFIVLEPESQELFRPFISANEYINNTKRYCLWLKDINPHILKKLKNVQNKVEKVREKRESSKREATKKLANYPTLFGEIRQPNSDYILIPRHSSENRKYIPMGFFTKEDIAADSCLIVPNGTLFHFGILTSQMHMTWVNAVCGRLKSDYRYSKDIVYNNFPWPESILDKQKEKIEGLAQNILDVRLKFPSSSLADLYDPLTMPPELVKGHQALDKAVDQAYRSQAFVSDASRLEFLFALYEKYTKE